MHGDAFGFDSACVAEIPTAVVAAMNPGSTVPTGRVCLLPIFPALKRRATLMHPFGMLSYVQVAVAAGARAFQAAS
jgi:hypothetical protein